MNTDELKTKISTLLNGLIGEYQFSDATTPAIWVGQIKGHIPVKTGLEVLLPVAPTTKRVRNTLQKKWELVLIQHAAPTEHIGEAMERFNMIKEVSNVVFHAISQEQRKSPEFLYLDFCEVTWLDWTSQK